LAVTTTERPPFEPLAVAEVGRVVDVVEDVVVVALGMVVVVGVLFDTSEVEVVGAVGVDVVMVGLPDVVVGLPLECVDLGLAPQADSTNTKAIKQAPRRTATSYRALADTWVETEPVPTLLKAATL
jgi:hypothetical protein